MRHIHDTLLRGRRGSALVEFMLIFGLIMFLFFGSIEFSLILKDYLTVGEAAAQGALVAARGENYTTVSSAITAIVPPQTPYDKITVTIKPVSGDPDYEWGSGDNPAKPADTIIVTVEYHHQLVTGLFSWLGSGGYMKLTQTGTNSRSSNIPNTPEFN